MNQTDQAPNENGAASPAEQDSGGTGAAIGNALRNRCPRCGSGTLFRGPLALAPGCPSCRLDYGRFNVGDGPAAFAILIMGALFCGLALWFEFSVLPPWWAHALLWPPLLVVATMAVLRYIKAALIGSEYANQAREGQIADEL